MSEALGRNTNAGESYEGSATMTRRIVERIEITASPERVFEALTDPAQLLAWWGDRASFPSTEWRLDPRVGGKWLSRWRGPGGASFALGGEISELVSPIARLLIVGRALPWPPTHHRPLRVGLDTRRHARDGDARRIRRRARRLRRLQWRLVDGDARAACARRVGSSL